MDGVDEVVAEFLVESHENLERFARELVELEHDPAGAALLGSIFRSIHTIKGTSGFLGFTGLERLTHAGEHLLARLRDGVQPMTPVIGDALLAMADAVAALLGAIEEHGAEGEFGHDDLVATLTGLVADPLGDDVVPTAATDPDPDSDAATAGTHVDPDPEADADPPADRADDPAGDAAGPGTDDDGPADGAVPQPPARPWRVGELLVAAGVVSAGEVSLAVHEQEMGDPRMLGEILADHGVTTEREIDAIVRAHGGPASGPGAGHGGSDGGGDAADAAGADSGAAARAGGGVAATTIRVDVRLLDELIRLVGELVLARNQIVEHTAGVRTPLAAAAQRLDLITAELQAQVMTTRMQPIGSAWRRFPRLLRDLAAACGKVVQLELEGADTELDRSLIEAVIDPLAHVVRNAVAHGIETPEERVAAGKPPEGTLTLRALHEDGQVHIEVRDDGRGIDPAVVRDRAVQTGLLTAQQASRMSDHDALELVFIPGFSTVTSVTNIAGRGVGMDVVKTNIEKISGVLELSSEVGVGTTVTMKIPLTLAIVPALIVSCHDERYAIPQNSVVELVPLRKDQPRAGIEMVHGVPVYRLRGTLLPLVFLHEQFGLTPRHAQTAATIVVLAVRDRLFGLVVDGVHNAEEIVVKPLARQLKSIPVYAGATIMGDGKVALILDVLGIAQRSRALAGVPRAEGGEPVATRRTGQQRTAPVVLVEGFAGERQAIALAAVSRLVQLPRRALERAAGRAVVQYDGGILPVVELGELTGTGPHPATADLLPTVVCHQDGRLFGLVVRRIVDIVELPERFVDGGSGGETAPPVVADGRVTELLAVQRVVRAVLPELFVAAPVASGLGTGGVVAGAGAP